MDNFQVGDIITWNVRGEEWKILSLCQNVGKLECIKTGMNMYSYSIGTCTTCQLDNAVKVERKRRTHPLTTIFKD